MAFFPIPAAADPLHIFNPDGPIAPAFMRRLLDNTVATEPLALGATPGQRAEHRLATMQAIAAYRPEDPVEATLAGQMVATNARLMQCFALSTEPDADQAEARRHGAQAASLTRCMQATLRGFQRQQAARRKDEAQPSERSGYWFRDVSVPAPESLPADDDPAEDPAPNPMQPEAVAPDRAPHHPASAPPPSAMREHPIHREKPETAPAPPSPNPSPGVIAGQANNAMSASGGDRPDRHLTGDAMMRFASRRLDPNQSVEAAWAQAVTEAAAEEAETTRP